MRSAWIPLSFVVGLAAFAACGDDDTTNNPDGPDGGASSSGGSSSGDASVDAAPPPTPAPFGLDTRPANATCVAKDRPPTGADIQLTDPFPGLPNFTKPVLFLQAPGDKTKNYVVEQVYTADGSAKVKVFANDAAVTTATDFLSLPAGYVKYGGAGEGGLLGFAFHPQWATNRTAFIAYTFDPPGGKPMATRISRVKSNDNGATLDPSTIEEILTIEKSFENHNGGHIAFGPDGNLYLGMGDGGSGNDPENNAQNPSSLQGKFLRITVGASGPYTTPADNPYKGGGGLPEVYAIGLRNPWRFSFDRVTGDLWAGDVGQGQYEEIDVIKRGGNYGWKVREGFHCRPGGPDPCPSAGLIDPVVEYDHSLGLAVTGGYVYRGSAIPQIVGKYLFADYSSGRVFTIDYDPGTGAASRRELLPPGPPVSSFGEDNDGEMYVVQYNGKIRKVALAGTPPPDTFPKKLSQTGCFEAGDPKKPVAALVPFGPVSPLWSDGADKLRWIALPDGKTITVKADGDFDFPIGTVLAKEFRIGGKRIETRLFMRHADGEWGGYSYEWNDAETEADLLPAGKTKTIAGQKWTYPDRAQCFACHSEPAGRSLGPEVLQLNSEFVYTSTNRISNQMATLDHIGFFDKPIGDPKALPTMVDPLKAGPSAEARARSYLHANCSGCHQPTGPGRGPADFRFQTAAKDVGVCNADPTEGDLGIAGAKLFAPGDPTKSVMSRRMRALDAARMPPLGSSVVHGPGADVIDAWITATTACP
jgi:uncharacterized repeat protein (TIGR03806 family)